MTSPNPNPKSLSTRLMTEPATQMHRRSDGGNICVISGHQWSSVVICGLRSVRMVGTWRRRSGMHGAL
jgi:hypothetical protein